MSFESGARAALKNAIVERDAAAARVEGAKSGLGRIEEEIFEGNKRIREARVAAAEEEDERIQAIIAGGATTLLARNGRVHEADIERDIASLRAARDLCRTALAEAQSALEYAEKRVIRAVGAVLAGSASRLIEKEENLRASLEGTRAVLKYLCSVLPDAQRREIDRRLPAGFADDRHAAVGPWRATAEALSENADAALPDA
jgi:hypothetical protein